MCYSNPLLLCRSRAVFSTRRSGCAEIMAAGRFYCSQELAPAAGCQVEEHRNRHFSNPAQAVSLCRKDSAGQLRAARPTPTGRRRFTGRTVGRQDSAISSSGQYPWRAGWSRVTPVVSSAACRAEQSPQSACLSHPPVTGSAGGRNCHRRSPRLSDSRLTGKSSR